MSGVHLPPRRAFAVPDSPGRSVAVATGPADGAARAPAQGRHSRSPDLPAVRDTGQPGAATAPQQRSSAAALHVALRGRELDWKDRARMVSGSALETLHAGVTHQTRQTADALGSLITPVVRHLENASECARIAAGTSALVATAAGILGAKSAAGAALGQQWKDGVGALIPAWGPAVLAGSALVGGVAAALDHVAPAALLRDLERIAEGPQAGALADRVDRVLAARPEDMREALRPILLAALPAMARLQQGPHAAAALDLVEHLLPAGWRASGRAAPSTPMVLDALPAIERMAQGTHAADSLALARELLGPGGNRADREARRNALLAAFDALASPHAAAVGGLIRQLHRTSPDGDRSEADDVLTGLARIAAAPDAAAMLDFVRGQLAACPEDAARGMLATRLAAALPVLGVLSESAGSEAVRGAFHHVLREHADPSTRETLRLALLDQLPAFGQLFAQSPADARAASWVARQGSRVPFGGRDQPGIRLAAAAVSQLTATRPPNPLNQLLGLATPAQAIAFWLAKAADAGSRA